MDLIDLFHKSQREALSSREYAEVEELRTSFPYFCLPYYIEAKRSQNQKAIFKAAAYSPNRPMLRDYLESTTIFLHMHQPEKPPSSIIDDVPIMQEPMQILPSAYNELFAILDFPSQYISPNGYTQPFSIEESQQPEQTHAYIHQLVKERSTKYLYLFSKIQGEIKAYKHKPVRLSSTPTLDPRSGTQEESGASPSEFANMFDNFIQNRNARPQAIPDAPIPSDEATTQSIEEDDEIVTETLASIHLKQRNYSEALRIYKKLRLVFPEKKAYFDLQIKKIQQLS